MGAINHLRLAVRNSRDPWNAEVVTGLPDCRVHRIQENGWNGRKSQRRATAECPQDNQVAPHERLQVPFAIIERVNETAYDQAVLRGTWGVRYVE